MTDVALVLLPGLDGSGVLFRPLLNHLPSEIQPIIVSYPPKQPLGYDQLFPQVLAALPKDKPFIILGESFSGPLTLMAAATWPDKLRGVILCASFIRNPMRFRAKWLRHLVQPICFRYYPEASRARAWLGGYSTPELQSLATQSLADVTPTVIAHRVRAALQVDVSQYLCRCPVPILYLHALRDRVIRSHNLLEILNLHPSVMVRSVPAPHMVLQTQPKLSAEAIAAFIESSIPKHQERVLATDGHRLGI